MISLVHLQLLGSQFYCARYIQTIRRTGSLPINVARVSGLVESTHISQNDYALVNGIFCEPYRTP